MSRRRPTVLVVEDNPITRKMMRVALQAASYAVLEAPDGRTALALMASERPDLVVQDLLLPDMDGFELVKRLRATPGGDAVPVLAVSGLSSKLEQGRLSSSGFTDFLAKPVEPSRLLRTIQSFLPAASPSPRGPAKGRLLLVDDDAVQRKLAGIRLGQLGFTVTLAEDGVDALERIRREPPDVVVSDVLMPRLDGFGLCRAIRAEPGLAALPVVLASSSYVEEEDHRLARGVGASAMVVRTPDLAELIDAVLAAARGELAPVTTPAPESVADDHVNRLICQLERQAAMNATLAQRCAFQAAELAMLGGTGDLLTRTRDVEAELAEVLARCLDAAGLSVGAIYLADEAGRLRVAAEIGYRESGVSGLETFFGHGDLLATVVGSGAPLVIPSPGVTADAAAGILEPVKATSALLVPMVARERVLGLLLLMGTRYRELRDEDWLPFAQSAATHMAQAIAVSRAFTQLGASERRYRRLFEAAASGIVLVDADSRIVDANPAMAALTGRELSELRALGLSDVLPSVSAGGLPSLGPGFDEDCHLLAKDGTRRTVTLSASEVDADLHLVMVSDVTERRRLEAHVAQTEKLAAMGTLLAGVVHELNNPLSVVLGHSMLLRHQVPPEHAERMEQVGKAAQRCARIVKNFLALARERPPEREVMSLNQVVREAVELMAYPLRTDSVEVVLRLSVGLPALWADAHALHQVVVNLISNAHHAMRETVAPRRLTLTTGVGQPGATAWLEVADSGPGIPPEVAARIFEPFFTTKPAGQGTGLGLSLCHGIVTSHHGSIRVESAPGAGARFRIELPVEAAPAPAAASASPAAPLAGSATILVVDDEVEMGGLLAEMLAVDGHRVDTVSDGQAALEKVGQGSYDLILSDVRMPGLDGRGLYEEIGRRHPALTRRFVFITGDTLGAETSAFLERTEARVLMKPFTVEDVRRIVQRALAG